MAYATNRMKGRKQIFAKTLRDLREGLRSDLFQKKGPSIRKLAEMAKVDFSLIGGLEAGKRQAGELTLRKLAVALQLKPEATEEFVNEGLSAAGTQPVIERHSRFPAQFLNELPKQVLEHCRGINPEEIVEIVKQDGTDLTWRMKDGTCYALEIKIGKGASPERAKEALHENLRRAARLGTKRKGI